MWTKNMEKKKTYPTLSKDIKTEIVIVGGGITGALTAHYFMKQGMRCVLVDKSNIATHATSASTAILKYEINQGLKNLMSQVGEQNAQHAFLFGYQAVMEISQIVKEINSSCDFSFKPAFFYTEDPRQTDAMEQECTARQAIGIHCELFTQENNKDEFSFNFESGIYSHYGAAIMNPVQFTHDLIKFNVDKGLEVFENTTIVDYNLSSHQSILTTENEFTITADKVIICTGVNALEFFNHEKPFCQLYRTFSILTKPVDNFIGWKDSCIIRNDQKPYTYVRPTLTNEIVIGGEDLAIDRLDGDIANMGDRDPLALQHYHQLLRRVRKMFPQINEIKTACWFHGLFIDTKDGLPFIGKHPDYPGAYFNLGYGSNGILNALIGAKLISQDVAGKNPRELDIFKFNRY
ncbi:FAD-binding oxidoreductase [Turicibacter sp. 1E2]|uniref:NAD(P)/FAD-dependent oxidoreductase n=1 Tax=Turicibacter sp. 1E2 TaxID=2951143 RepID=UPI0021D513B9|nr:FAD-dependent oxidoreductase [Turicibacter sp. 1E2]MCU7208453.1 FAD-binding oxidoreductase [Turicibacter sp. 1E2]